MKILLILLVLVGALAWAVGMPYHRADPLQYEYWLIDDRPVNFGDMHRYHFYYATQGFQDPDQ
jgi:hypothetical protein